MAEVRLKYMVSGRGGNRCNEKGREAALPFTAPLPNLWEQRQECPRSSIGDGQSAQPEFLLDLVRL